MLIVTRRVGETLMIGDTVLCVVAGKGNSVQIGIAAHKDVKIVREELLQENELIARYNKVGYMDVGATKSHPSRRDKSLYYENNHKN